MPIGPGLFTGRLPHAQTFARGASAGGSQSFTNSWSLALPGNYQPGDLLVAYLAIDPGVSGDPGVVIDGVPAGWMLVHSAFVSQAGFAVYTHVAGSSEPASYTWTTSAPTSSYGYVMATLGQASAADAKATHTNTATTTWVAPSVTPTVANELLLCAYMPNNPSAWNPNGPPAGMTLLAQATNPIAHWAIGVYAQQITAPGATGTRTLTVTTSAVTDAAESSITFQ